MTHGTMPLFMRRMNDVFDNYLISRELLTEIISMAFHYSYAFDGNQIIQTQPSIAYQDLKQHYENFDMNKICYMSGAMKVKYGEGLQCRPYIELGHNIAYPNSSI